jgi:hypothetical protein
MPDKVKHVDNDTPNASADGVKTMYKDTPTGDRDPATQGVGASPLPTNPEHVDDPKSGGTPVHRRPSPEHAHS